MRILHVITSLRIGGAEKLMVDLLPRLRDMGNDVELLVFDGIETPFMQQLRAQGIRIHISAVGRSVYHPVHLWHLMKLMRQYDVVHTHNTAPQLFTAIASLAARRVLCVTTEHNTTNRRRDKWYLKMGDMWMYRQYQRIICISDQAEKNLRSYLAETSDKICTIYNGIDVKKYNSVPSTSDGSQKTDFTVAMVAAFREQKDQKTLIRAMAKLPQHIRLRLIGTGEAVLIAECKALAEELRVSDRVDFLGMRSDVPELLAQADAVVLSSHYEGLSLSSLEGMASGKPFIASDVEGLYEIVSGYGLLVPHQDADTLAGVIRQVAEDSDYAAAVAARCLERAKQFDIFAMASKYNQVYQELHD